MFGEMIFAPMALWVAFTTVTIGVGFRCVIVYCNFRLTLAEEAGFEDQGRGYIPPRTK